MLSQLSRATRSRSAIAAVSRVTRGNAVQVRGFIAPTISRRGKLAPQEPPSSPFASPFDAAGLTRPVGRARIPIAEEAALHPSSDVAKTPLSAISDFVQELYLKELSAYKTPAVKADDAVGNVQVFNEPKTPASPEETDLASNLQAYENMAVEIEGQDVAAQSATGATEAPDWLEAEEDDEPHH